MLLWLIVVFYAFTVLGIKISEVNVPRYHLASKEVQLNCSYEHASGRPDPLYSVKWYRNGDHFYEYSPTQPNKIKAFPFPGIKVDRFKSVGTSVVLTQVTKATSGLFRCEVMGDKPLFETESLARNMTIVDPPAWGPEITGLKHNQKVKLGDRVTANCSVGSSFPSANVTWVFNGIRSRVGHRLPQTTSSNPWAENVVHLHLDLLMKSQYFEKGILRLECLAEIYNVFHRSEIISILDIDKPQPDTQMLWGLWSSAARYQVSYILNGIALALSFLINN